MFFRENWKSSKLKKSIAFIEKTKQNREHIVQKI